MRRGPEGPGRRGWGWPRWAALAVGIACSSAGMAAAQPAGTAGGVGHSAAGSGPAAASDAGVVGVDYEWRNTDWNGLSQLAAAEAQVGRALAVDTDVDLSALTPSQPVALIYPRGNLPVADLLAWVHDGGRLLVADDFGSSGPLLEALGLSPVPGPLPHNTFLNDNDQLPVLHVSSDDPLVTGVHQVVANHPQVLAGPADPVIAYDRPGFGLLYDLAWGSGRVIVLGDPSMLVNFMLAVGDDRALAMNLFDALCNGIDPCRVAVVTDGRGALSGRYVAAGGAAEPEGVRERLQRVFGGSFQAVNALLQGVAELRPNQRGVFYASVFLGIGIVAFLLSALPLTRPRWLSFSLRTPAHVRSRSEYEWNLERLLKAGRQGDYGLPLAILKDEFEELFMGELAQHQGELALERRYEADQLERFARRYGERVAEEGAARQAATAQALATLRALARIPSRNSLVPEVDGRYSERLLRRLHGDVRALLTRLGIWDRYERRTGRP